EIAVQVLPMAVKLQSSSMGSWVLSQTVEPPAPKLGMSVVPQWPLMPPHMKMVLVAVSAAIAAYPRPVVGVPLMPRFVGDKLVASAPLHRQASVPAEGTALPFVFPSK